MLAEIIRGILTLVVGIGLILYISPKLTLIMLSVIPVVVVIAVYLRQIHPEIIPQSTGPAG